MTDDMIVRRPALAAELTSVHVRAMLSQASDCDDVVTVCRCRAYLAGDRGAVPHLLVTAGYYLAPEGVEQGAAGAVCGSAREAGAL